MHRITALAIMVLLVATLSAHADTSTAPTLPVTSSVMATQTLSFGASDTAKSTVISSTGRKVHTIVLTVPNWTNTVTAILSANNANGDEIWTDDTARAENDTYVFHQLGDQLPLVGATTFTVTLSGVPGGSGGDVELTIYTE